MKKYIEPVSRQVDIDLRDLYMVVSGDQFETLTFEEEKEGTHEADVKAQGKNLWDDLW